MTCRGHPAFWLGLLLTCAILPPAHAHPLTNKKAYDRYVTVRLTSTAVVVEYGLELHLDTLRDNMDGLLPREELQKLTTDEQVITAYLRETAPQITYNLVARLDGQELKFTCDSTRYKTPDHVHCDFRLKATWQPQPSKKHHFTFQDANFSLVAGKLALSLESDDSVNIMEQKVPDEHLKARHPLDLGPGDEKRLRNLEAHFQITTLPPSPPEDTPEEEPTSKGIRPRSLQDLLFHSQLGMWLLLGVAGLFGAAHALTPGHGKTVVAAYLVGERGTVGHALLLGLVVTLTHTGAVLLVAAILPFFFPNAPEHSVQMALEFGGGLLIVLLGFWLVQRRLTGRADHVHLFGHHHHHHDHEPGSDHHHDYHHHHNEPVNTWGLILLGISGGIVPCGEAIALFSLAVRWGRLEMAFPLLLAFSAGLASVLIAIGMGVVYAKRFTSDRWTENPRLKRIAGALPIVSAALVTILGLWLCYHSLQSVEPH